jgi:hypothetical protein
MPLAVCAYTSEHVLSVLTVSVKISSEQMDDAKKSQPGGSGEGY